MIPDAAVDAAYRESPADACLHMDQADVRLMLEAAAPHMLGDAQAQAIEDALIDFGRESVFLTAAQETMSRFLRARVAELRSK